MKFRTNVQSVNYHAQPTRSTALPARFALRQSVSEVTFCRPSCREMS